MNRLELQSHLAIALIRFRDNHISAAEAAEAIMSVIQHYALEAKRDAVLEVANAMRAL